ncbi:MAG: tetratricopeptide repeat protein [Alphaproteobacteria bacterium]|nr:tetratricopeptide repeat protein [Alphaproteobacteria bacterium]
MAVAVQLQGMLLMQGKVSAAAEVAAAIKASGTRDPLSDLVLAMQALHDNKIDDTVKVLESANQNGNLQLWVPLLLGWVNYERGQVTKPLTLDIFSIDIGRASPLINYHMALINERAGFIEAATANLAKAAEDPRLAPPRIMQRLAAFSEAHDNPKELAAVLQAYQPTGDEPQTALPVIGNARDGVAEVLYTMGGIMFSAGVVNDAAIYLQLAAYVKPDMGEAQLALGDAYSQLQQYARSNAAYENVTPQDELYGRAQLHIAVNYDRMGREKDALALLDKLAAQDKDNADALITKGDLHRIHGRYQEAINTYNKGLARIGELSSDDWPVLFARGSCLERLGRWPEARKDLQAALDLKPDQPDVLNYLGYAQLERGENLAAAQAMIARAVEARPNDAQIVDSMAWVLYKQGNYEESLAYMEKAVEMMPSDPTVNDHLGDVYWRLGRKTEARFQWQRSLSYSPDAKLESSLHKKLKQGLPPAPTMASTAVEKQASAAEATDSATP